MPPKSLRLGYHGSPTEKLVDASNSLPRAMTGIIMKHGAGIDNFIGDTIMAVFGIPVIKTDDAARDVACAPEVQNLMRSVDEEIEPPGLPEPMIGIGLGAGAEMRVKFGVIDSTVYLAAGVESISGGDRIFASRATYDEVKDNIATARHLDIERKGISHPTAIDELTGITDRYALEKATKPGPGA